MATPLTASRLLSALRAEGCAVAEVGNWRTHNRNRQGAWGPVNGILIHHTVTSGSAATVRILRDGYAGLPGPLCHGGITKDGRVHLIGHGRANHAGSGDSAVLRAVIAEKPTPRPTANNTDGNSRFYGFECENLGDGRDPWPDAQVEAIARASAAICRAHGWNERSVIGHAEWTNTKIDPRRPGQNASQFMDAIRARVRQLLAAPAGAASTPSQEDDMQLNDKLDVGKWLADRFPKDGGLQDGSIYVRTALASGYGWSRIAADNSERILARMDAQQVAIDKLADALGKAGAFDPEALKQEIREAIESITVNLEVENGS